MPLEILAQTLPKNWLVPPPLELAPRLANPGSATTPVFVSHGFFLKYCMRCSHRIEHYFHFLGARTFCPKIKLSSFRND